jgi:hypothetical protein
LEPGVTSALRFCEMVSSIAPRETRRKSRGLRYERELGAGGQMGRELPRRAVWLKQNWGVRCGASGGLDMTGPAGLG